MGLFSRSYYKEGPGVDPDEPQKRSFFRFFDIFKRKLGHFAKANLLYSLVCIPAFVIIFFLMSYMTSSAVSLLFPELKDSTIGVLFLTVIFSAFYIAVMGAGPVTAGFTFIMRNYAREEHAWVWSDFKDTFKSNFKQGIVVFIIDIVVTILVFIASYVYVQLSGGIAYLRYVLYVLAGIYAIMHFYIYQLMITYDLSIMDIMKNSLIFALIKLPVNLLMLIVQFLIHIALPVFIILKFAVSMQFTLIIAVVLMVLELALTQSFTSFMVNFGVQGTIKKFMSNDETIEN